MSCRSAGCCCGKCHKKASCSNEYAPDTEAVTHLCCACLPKMVCVRLYSSSCPCTTDGETGTGSLEIAKSAHGEYSCSLGGYSVTLSCRGVNIDLLFSFLIENGLCYFYLESTALGYTDAGTGSDSRIKFPLNDTGTGSPLGQEALCNDLDIEFDVDLSAALPGCGAGIVRIVPDDVVCIAEPETEACFFDGLGIYYRPPGASDLETESSVPCVTTLTGSPALYSWSANFSGGVSITITTPVDGGPDTRDFTISYSGPGTVDEETKAGSCEDFLIAWEVSNGSRIRIAGDKRPRNLCMCACRCLCVTMIPTEPGSALSRRFLMCWNEETEQWEEGETGTGTGAGNVIYIDNQCSSNNVLRFLGVDSAVDFTCPNIDVEWLGVEFQGETVDIYAVCQQCAECVLPDLIEVDCGCLRVPRVLTATIENEFGCENLDGLSCPITYDFDPTDPRWVGRIDAPGGPIIITMKCDNTCDDEDTGTGTNATCTYRITEDCADLDSCAEVCECEPFEALFGAIGGGCSFCDDPAISAFKIRVTE